MNALGGKIRCIRIVCPRIIDWYSFVRLFIYYLPRGCLTDVCFGVVAFIILTYVALVRSSMYIVLVVLLVCSLVLFLLN